MKSYKYLFMAGIVLLLGCTNKESNSVKQFYQCDNKQNCFAALQQAQYDLTECKGRGQGFLRYNPNCFKEEYKVKFYSDNLSRLEILEEEYKREQKRLEEQAQIEKERAVQEKRYQEIIAEKEKEQLRLAEEFRIKEEARIQKNKEREEQVRIQREYKLVCESWMQKNCKAILVSKTNCTTEVYRSIWGNKVQTSCDENYKAVCTNENTTPNYCLPLADGGSVYSDAWKNAGPLSSDFDNNPY